MSLILVIFITGYVSSFIGTIAGGGALITLPVLIFLGVSLRESILIEKVGSFAASCSGYIAFRRSNAIQWQIVPLLIVVSIVFGLIGTYLQLSISDTELEGITGSALLILGLAIPFIKRELFEGRPPAKPTLGGIISYSLLRVYSGIIGAGAGLFSGPILCLGFDCSFIQARATESLPRMALHASTTAVLLSQIDYASSRLLAYTAGMILGGLQGALFVGSSNNRLLVLIVSTFSVLSGALLLLR